MNLDLVLRLAILQARVSVLNRMADDFTDLVDMQAHRHLRSGVEQYVAKLIAKGNIQSDPLADAIQRLKHIERVLQAIHEQYLACLTLVKQVRDPGKKSLTRQKIEELRIRAQNVHQQLPEKLRELFAQMAPEGWIENGDLDPRLWAIVNLVLTEAPLLKLPIQGLRQLALGSGPLYDDLQLQLCAVPRECDCLLMQHQDQQEVLSAAKELAATGNHVTASYRVSKLPMIFADLDYQEVSQIQRQWEEPLRACLKTH